MTTLRSPRGEEGHDLSDQNNVPDNSRSCFLCGQVNLLASFKQPPENYHEQITLFKTYLGQPTDNDVTRDGVEACASCVQDVTAVWEMTQQIKVIQRNIATIVERVTATRQRGELHKSFYFHTLNKIKLNLS